MQVFMCMCVFLQVCVCHVHMCEYVYACLCSMYMHMCAPRYGCMSACVHFCEYVCFLWHIQVHLYKCVHMYGRDMCTYVYSYIYTLTHPLCLSIYVCLLRHMCLYKCPHICVVFVHIYVHFQSCKFTHHLCIDVHVYVFSRYAYLPPHVCLLSMYMHTNICVCIQGYTP